MKLHNIKAKIRAGLFKFSWHAEIEAEADNLAIAQVVDAILSGEIYENYPDSGRGESCLIVGFSGKIPIHAICGMRADNVIIVTVYIPRPPKFIDPWTRGEK